MDIEQYNDFFDRVLPT